MDRDQHITQDAAEHYAVYLMAKHAEELGVATLAQCDSLWESFILYLEERGWDFDKHFCSIYPEYKANVDSQIPIFVRRLLNKFPKQKFHFSIDEAAFRVQGRKADFSVHLDAKREPYHVSLKNYIGSGGISRPQVSSGTFLSFAAGFVFERVGVGTYQDPRELQSTFSGSNKEQRDAVLIHQDKEALIPYFDLLEALQQQVRNELLSLRYYDQAKVRRVIESIVPQGQEAILRIFEILGNSTVRSKLLERVGLDGTEEILYFDNTNSLDSITNDKFHFLCKSLNNESTEFIFQAHKQSLIFQFNSGDKQLIRVDVPLTINTNGAWHRPKVRYTGKQKKIDKNHEVYLEWGELRPYKSREIATSTNSYLNLKATGVFA